MFYVFSLTLNNYASLKEIGSLFAFSICAYECFLIVLIFVVVFLYIKHKFKHKKDI